MLNMQFCLFKEEVYDLFLPRRLGTDVVNSLVTSVLTVWPGHSGSQTICLSQSVYNIILSETLIRSSTVSLESGLRATLFMEDVLYFTGLFM